MMTNRPQLTRIVFTYDPDEALLDAVTTHVPGADVVVADDDTVAEQIAGAQLVIGGTIPDNALARADALVWQHVTWAGVESILTPGLKERGIVLTNSRGVSAPNMAEHVLAMMLALGRAIPYYVKKQEQRVWRGWYERPPTYELTGQTVVLLGTGAIGKATATRLRAFGCRVIGARRRPSPLDEFHEIIGFDDLPRVLPEADHVVSSLPMTPHTEKLLSAELIDAMKPGAYFFNVGRGGTVDQDALISALEDGRLGGAGLDVTDPEPLPEDSPLWSLPNVLITAHTSGASPQVGPRVVELMIENLRRYEAGEDLLNVVDYDQGY
ncbi:MAG TPA: D-2-hydroxyacid dehydrogenase [Thermomicrobiales bacterium]|nr:D-2-hydroxyacid dehydrogenase [Thermomicrobiales bacterium]